MKKSDELKISEEAVLEASEKCSDAKKVLKVLFPSAFKKKSKDITEELTLQTQSFHHSTEGKEYFFVIKHGENNVLFGECHCEIKDRTLIMPLSIHSDYDVKLINGNFKVSKK